MKISGFSYVRNGFRYGYPFLESIQSILPLCDEFIMAVGDSDDGTREAIINLNNPKIKIIDTIWDENLRASGKIFAQQSNIALFGCTGDWLFHIQADEVIHENDVDKIHKQIIEADNNPVVQGLLFDFLNFWGSYDYLNDIRYQHRKEIRIFRNHLNVYSYRDSQGFRWYSDQQDYHNGTKGNKLKVLYTGIPVYHYSYVRSPQKMYDKSKYFEKFWHNDDYIETKYQEVKGFDYYNIERVKKFEGTHPALMKDRIASYHWEFDPMKLNKKISIKDKLLYWIEDRLHRRIGEYKNYILLKK